MRVETYINTYSSGVNSMRKVSVLLILVMLLVPSAVANTFEVSDLNGVKLPSGVVGNERVSLYIDCSPYRFDVIDSVIQGASEGERVDSTVKIKISEETATLLANRKLSFNDAIKQDKITFEAVSFKNKVKLWLIGFFKEVAIEKINCEIPVIRGGPIEYVMTILPGEKQVLEEPVLEIRVDDEVTFENMDDANHILVLEIFTFVDGMKTFFETVRQPLTIGDRVKYSLDTVGEIYIHDEVTENLRGKIVVEEKCNGCQVLGRCLEVGSKVALDEPVYCSVDSMLVKQKVAGAQCEINYECLSNVCNDDKCSN
jgi:plastocyanin